MQSASAPATQPAAATGDDLDLQPIELTPPPATKTPATTASPARAIEAAPVDGASMHQANALTTTSRARKTPYWLIGGVSTGAVGLGLIGGAAYFGLRGLDQQDRLRAKGDDGRWVENQPGADSLNRQRLDSFRKANYLFGFGGVAVAASVGMLAYSLFAKDELHVFVTPTRKGASVSTVW